MLATTDISAVGANAAVILVALGGFYRFAMNGLDKHISQNVTPQLSKAIDAQAELAKQIDKHAKQDSKRFKQINRRLDQIDEPARRKRTDSPSSR